MNETKRIKTDIIVALLSNPNYIPTIESTVTIAKDLILLVEANNTELANLIKMGEELIQEFKESKE